MHSKILDGTYINIKKVKRIETLSTYNLFVNWVSGEFDLHLQNETKKLIISFPNGSFDIGNFNEDNNLYITIHVKGKSKVACAYIMNRLDKIYHHVLLFNQKNKFNDTNC